MTVAVYLAFQFLPVHFAPKVGIAAGPGDHQGTAAFVAVIDLGSPRAQQEFGGAQLGDTRLSRRLVASANTKAKAPSRAFCGAAKGDRAAMKGYYRMISGIDRHKWTIS